MGVGHYDKTEGIDEEDKLQKISMNYLEQQKKAKLSSSGSFIKSNIGREVWRFFIEGRRQNEGQAPINYFLWLGKKHQFSYLDSPLLSIITPATYKHMSPEIQAMSSSTIAYVEQAMNLMNVSKTTLQDTKDQPITLRHFLLRDRGWLPFEATEPNYLKPLIDTLLFLEQDNSSKLDINFIKTIHERATQKVLGLLYNKVKNKPGQFRAEPTERFDLNLANVTKEGIYELLDKIESHQDDDPSKLTIKLGKELVLKVNDQEFSFKQIDYKNLQTISEYYSGDIAEAIMDQINDSLPVRFSSHIESNQRDVTSILDSLMTELIEKYETAISQAVTHKDKLKCIITLIQDMEQLHPFNDANCRTFCMLLFPHLLRMHGFPPPLMQDPNQFDCYSIDELVTKTINGMENTLAVSAGKKDLNSVTTENILTVATDKEREYAKELGLGEIGVEVKAEVSKIGFFSKPASEFEGNQVEAKKVQEGPAPEDPNIPKPT